VIFRKITETIWQSDEDDARKACVESPKWLELGIKAVICPAFNVRLPYAPALASLILPVWDDTLVDAEWFDFAVSFHRRFGPTLVHCHGGLNRSVTFAAAIALADGQSLDQSFKIMGEPVFRQMRDSLKRWAETRKER
jgi:protein-tyrosine phosphatase